MNDNFLKDLVSVLHLEVDEEMPHEGIDLISRQEKLYDKVLHSTSRIRISLSDNLKLFFNFQPAIKYSPGKEKDAKNCTLLGMDIFF